MPQCSSSSTIPASTRVLGCSRRIHIQQQVSVLPQHHCTKMHHAKGHSDGHEAFSDRLSCHSDLSFLISVQNLSVLCWHTHDCKEDFSSRYTGILSQQRHKRPERNACKWTARFELPPSHVFSAARLPAIRAAFWQPVPSSRTGAIQWHAAWATAAAIGTPSQQWRACTCAAIDALATVCWERAAGAAALLRI